jgi:peptidoglycan/LPS O-acetylase OafA/YrhL
MSDLKKASLETIGDSRKVGQETAQHYTEVNYLRGFAILSVISIHVSASFRNMTNINSLTVLYMAIDSLSQVAVPAFISISGFGLYNSYNVNFQIGHFYRKRFKYILPPYFIFSTLYAICNSEIRGKLLNFDLSSILIMYLTGGACYHLWFFALIIPLYLLYPLIVKIYIYFENKNDVVLFLLVAFLLGMVYDIFLYKISLFATYMTFIGYLFYFIFGMFIKSNYESIKLKSFSKMYYFSIFIFLLLKTFLGIVSYANKYFSYNLFSFGPRWQIWRVFEAVVTPLYFIIIFTVILYISIFLSKSKRLQIIDKLGSYSFSIYLIHAMLLALIVLALSKIGFNWNNLLFYPYAFALTLILSIFSVKIFEQIPYGNYIIGKKS